jgi:hypothetical protein
MNKRSNQAPNTADQEEDATIVGVDLGKTGWRQLPWPVDDN